MYHWKATAFFIACIIIWVVQDSFRKRFSKSNNGKPPGPRPLPIIGNVFDIPRQKEWETFSKWAQEYGDIVFLSIFGRPLIILNSVEATTELLLDRSAIYSDRPYFPLLDMTGHLATNVGFMPYGKEWTSLRKVFASGFSKANLITYYESHRRATMNMLKNFERNPKNYAEHFKLHAVQLVIDVTYGIHVTSFDHHLVHLATRVLGAVSSLINPLTLILNPALLVKVLPGCLGGSGLSHRIERWKRDLREFQVWPFEQTKSDMISGSYRPSFTSCLLQELEGKEADSTEEILIRNSAAAAYGAQTTAAAVTFLLAMHLYPEAQKRAQEEIDLVVGTDRLPDFKDRDHLPYVSATLKEVLRWHSPTPQAMPHMLSQDDHYRGFHLPAGSIIIGNAWNILHDPAVFKDPLAFRPERHLGSLSEEVAERMEVYNRIPFGFGRRLCPGKAFAEDALWLLFAQFLAVFRVTPDPNFPPAKAEFTSGPLSHAAPFNCNIKTRSESAKLLLEVESSAGQSD
ncbi:cytochrome P450 [Gymnopilus junonius]|uniref:Cytochrome P450 n=1 Tax=Gymnopilus junonius TaxID=109634 RepID=A0A9P5TM39_GYMJU|nr:cytochrome P450 [Gymnopilus junonius]